jgi:methanogenic corrinoid protein MtbC1
MSMDSRGVAELMRRQISVGGVVATWEDVLVPVLEGIGQRWEQTGEGIEIEHQFAETTISTLNGVVSRLTQPRNTAQVLLSCANEELHSLPLYALAAALAERGIDARVLGARVPTDALAAAVRRTGPAIVFVYASMPVPPGTIDILLRRTRPTPQVLLGGPGWGPGALPSYAERVTGLSQAVSRVAEAVAH